MILTDIIVRPLFCPYYTTSAKYGTNWVLLRKSVVLLAEEYLRKGLPQKSRSEFYGKRSSEHRSKAARNAAACIICSAATKRRGTLLAEIIFESKRNVNLLGSSRGVSRRILAKSPVGSSPPANLGMPHCSGHSLTEAAFPLRRRDGGLPKARRKGCRSYPSTSLAPPVGELSPKVTEGVALL